jgi:hypothetical protein
MMKLSWFVFLVAPTFPARLFIPIASKMGFLSDFGAVNYSGEFLPPTIEGLFASIKLGMLPFLLKLTPPSSFSFATVLKTSLLFLAITGVRNF